MIYRSFAIHIPFSNCARHCWVVLNSKWRQLICWGSIVESHTHTYIARTLNFLTHPTKNSTISADFPRMMTSIQWRLFAYPTGWSFLLYEVSLLVVFSRSWWWENERSCSAGVAQTKTTENWMKSNQIQTTNFDSKQKCWWNGQKEKKKTRQGQGVSLYWQPSKVSTSSTNKQK
jgi:hypothetical protein